MSRFEHYQDKGNEWRWRFVSTNGRIIAASSEGYKSEADCVNGIRLLKTEAPTAPVNKVEPTTITR